MVMKLLSIFFFYIFMTNLFVFFYTKQTNCKI